MSVNLVVASTVTIVPMGMLFISGLVSNTPYLSTWRVVVGLQVPSVMLDIRFSGYRGLSRTEVVRKMDGTTPPLRKCKDPVNKVIDLPVP